MRFSRGFWWRSLGLSFSTLTDEVSRLLAPSAERGYLFGFADRCRGALLVRARLRRAVETFGLVELPVAYRWIRYMTKREKTDCPVENCQSLLLGSLSLDGGRLRGAVLRRRWNLVCVQLSAVQLPGAEKPGRAREEVNPREERAVYFYLETNTRFPALLLQLGIRDTS